MTPTLEELQRGAAADKTGHCAVCAYLTGQLVKATQKAYQHEEWVNLCNHHAREIRQARMDESRRGKRNDRQV